MTKFTLSIEFDDALHVEILAVLSDIVANEGKVIIHPSSFGYFLQDIEDGLLSKANTFPYIIGAHSGGLSEEWLDISKSLERIAGLIRHHIT